MRIFEKVAR